MATLAETEFFLDDLVATDEIPMLEVCHSDDLETTLLRLMSSEIPGFVIRSLGTSNNNTHAPIDVTKKLIATLAELGHDFEYNWKEEDFSLQRGIGLGELHTDIDDIHQPVENIDIHTTTCGAGRVLMANSGPGIEHVLSAHPHIGREDIYDVVGKHILAGRTDPKIVLPTLHTSAISTDDTVVFTPANCYGGVAHRFDTTKGPRLANLVDISRA